MTHLRRTAHLLLLVATSITIAPAVAQEKPRQTDLKETVVVRLAEVEILVTDKRGDAITDLTLEDFEVREKGRKARLAFLEPFATASLATRRMDVAEPLLGTEVETPADEQPDVTRVFPVPPPRRRVVLLFDAYNSRTPERERWTEAARQWVETDMRPSDTVCLAVMERGEVRVVLPFTSNKEFVLGQLPSVASEALYYDSVNEVRKLLDDLQTCVSAYDQESCALSASQSYLFEWRVRTRETLGGLRRFAATLAAVPGRKAVFYISNGVVMNPGEMVANAVLATFGTDAIARDRLLSTLDLNLYQEQLEMLNVSGTADVTFFTFDTRNSSLRDVSWLAEERVKVHERMVADPFATVFDETRGSLDTMAIETGGRSYHGPKIEANLPRAVRAMEGLYTLGYYAQRPEASVKIKIKRKDAVLSFANKARTRRGPAETARLELGVAKPQLTQDGVVLPLMTELPLAQLSFTKKDGRYRSLLAIYAEAVSPAGERAADVFELVEVQLSDAEHEARKEKKFVHAVGLAVKPGAYRLRARVCDADFRQAAERTLDLTVHADGTLSPGIQDRGSIQESGRNSTPDDDRF